MKLIRHLKATLSADDSPGISDQPEVDIKTHRSMGSFLSNIGGIFFFGTLAASNVMNDPLLYGIAGVAASGFVITMGQGMKIQALRWENELLHQSIREVKN